MPSKLNMQLTDFICIRKKAKNSNSVSQKVVNQFQNFFGFYSKNLTKYKKNRQK